MTKENKDMVIKVSFKAYKKCVNEQAKKRIKGEKIRLQDVASELILREGE